MKLESIRLTERLYYDKTVVFLIQTPESLQRLTAQDVHSISVKYMKGYKIFVPVSCTIASLAFSLNGSSSIYI